MELTTAANEMDGSVAKTLEGQRRVSRASWLSALDRLMTRVENIVILTSYAALILLIGVETIRRAVTGQQAVWGPDVALYAFVWLSWFSMAKHGRFGTHLAFCELRARMPPLAQRGLELLDCALWLAVGSIIIFASYGIVEKQVAMGQTVFGTPIPVALASLAVPVGWAFSMIRIVQRAALVIFAWDRLKSERTGLLNL